MMSLRFRSRALMPTTLTAVLLFSSGGWLLWCRAVAAPAAGLDAAPPSARPPGPHQRPGDLGIACSPLTPERLDALRVTQGVVIDQVYQGGAGQKAGLKPDDVIQKVDGREVQSPDELSAALNAAGLGARLTLSLVRDGALLTLTATLGEASLALVRTLAGHQDAVNAVAFAPDGKLLASGSADRTVRLWEVETGRLVRSLEGHSEEVQAVAFSPDGSTLVSCGDEVRLWEVRTGALKRTLKLDAPVIAAVFSPDGKLLATGSADHAARLWDPETGILQKSLKEHQCARVTTLAFSPDGQTLATGAVGGDDDAAVGEVRLWDVRTGEPKRSPTGQETPWRSVVFSPDGKTLIGGTADAPGGAEGSVLCLWDAETGALRRSLPLAKASLEAVAVSPNGRLLATGDYSRDEEDLTIASLGVWDIGTGKLKRRIRVDRGFLIAVAFAPDGKTLATAGSARVVKLWRMAE